MPEKSTQVTIRVYETTDEDAVISLWQVAGLLRPWNDPTKDIARKLKVQPELFLVAADGGQILGSVMAGYDGHRGWLYYLAVDPATQRCGIGRALVDAARSRLQALGCPKINLQPRSGNDGAVAFYEALGFEHDPVVSMGLRLIPDD
ncbi:MAG: GNAT family acetyltransferase [Alphaproteobacteria bacterium]